MQIGTDGAPPDKILEKNKKYKKNKYQEKFWLMRRDFTPLVYTVYGVVVRDARSAKKHLEKLLADKWRR